MADDFLDSLLRQGQPADPLDAFLEQDRASRLATVLRSSGNPDEVAKANALARSRGVPPQVIQNNLRDFEQQDEIDKNVSLAQRYPAIGHWSDDPRNAALAKDDTTNLARNSQYWQQVGRAAGSLKAPSAPDGTFVNALKGIGQIFVYGGQALKGAIFDLGDALLTSPEDRQKRDRATALYGEASTRTMAQMDAFHGQAQADASNPQFQSWYARGAYGASSSLAQMTPGLVASVLTGNPAPALASAGLTSGSQAYEKYRQRGATVKEASLGGALEGGIEVGTELLPMGFLTHSLGKTGAGHFLTGFLSRELPGELAATIGQDAVDTAIANPDKTWGDYFQQLPGDLADTAVQTFMMTGALGVVNHAGQKISARVQKQTQGLDEAIALGKAMDAAAESKVRARDQEAFRQFIEQHLDGTPGENIYVPADKVASYLQSADFDWHEDSFWGGYQDQIAQGLATGGDVVFPTAAAATHLAGTPAWDALKPDVRATAGGMSMAEAQSIEAEHGQYMERLGAEMAAQLDDEHKAQEPRNKLLQSLADKLQNAGFTPNIARQQAELLTQRASTRASRLGQDLTGAEYNALTINQVLPEKLAQAQKADQIDIVINAMKRGAEPSKQRGQSLLEYVSRFGGIEDKGGDIASMGGERWHVGKPGKKKLIRETAAKGQGNMLGPSVSTGFGIDDYALRAWEAGYFPTHADRPTVQDFLDAVDAELRGDPRYVDLGGADVASQTQDVVAQAADELRALLENAGVDPDTASAKEIRAAIEAHRAQAEGAGFDQPPTESAAFKAWFGDSKVVDAAGKPLVVYHGTNQPLEAFSFDRGGMATGKGGGATKGFFFTSDENEAGDYAENAGNVVVSNVEQFERERSRLQKEVSRLEKVAQRTNKRADWDAYEQAMLAWETLEIDATREDPNVGRNVIAGYLSIQNPMTIDFAGGKISSASDLETQVAAAKAAGHDGLILRNINDSPKGGYVSDHFVAFEATQIKSADNRGTFDPADPRILHQSFADGPRGRITFPGSGQAIIDLFQSRDQSTFLHESGHLWLEELRFDATQDDAPGQLKADWQAVQDWFKANGHPIDGDTIPVDAHELWARGVERYLMEGKAPVPALRKMFDAFKSWLVSIYRSVDRLKSPITDDIRAVMDRLIATDAEIAQARAQQHLEAGFTEQPATMSDAEWQDYGKLTTDAKDAAHDALLAKVMNAVKRRVTKEYKVQQAEVRAAVSAEIDARPEFRALRQVRQTPLDASWLREVYGPDALALIPKSVPPSYRDGGANADEVAELSGFKSGDEMVRALMGVETARQQLREGGDLRSVREALISQETDARMNARYGDPFTDGSIEEEALAAIHDEKQGEVLAAELRVLARATNAQPTPYSVAKAWAARTVREGVVRDVVSRSAIQTYRRAAAKAGKASVDAILAGDHAKAFKQKQKQMLNNALVSEAQKVADEVDKAAARLEKWARRKTIASVDQDYLERAQALLEQVELRPRTQRSLDRQAQFEAWATTQAAEGHDIVVPASFAASLGTTHWTRLPVEQFLGLDAAVDQIIHLGKLKQTLLDNKEARDAEAVIQEALTQNDGAKRNPPVTGFMEPGYYDRAKSFVLGIDAAMLKMETIFDWLDNGDPNGVYSRVAFQPLVEAQEARRVLMKDKLAKIEEARLKVPQATRKRWRDKIALDFIDPETGQLAVMTRDQLIVMALNMGNEGNARKLAGGYGWNEAAILDMLNRELTPQEWQFVQDVWDIIDEFWPAASAMERRVNGVAPDKVEARTIQTPGGTLKGGYFPVTYDPTRNLEAEKQKAKEGAGLFEGGYKRPNTRAGSLNERTEVMRPILLSLGVINQHVIEMAHDITHREALMNTYKFLNEPRIVREVREVLNVEIQKQFNPWLDHIAKEWVSNTTGTVALEKAIKNIRINATFVGMAYRVSTGMMQVAGLFNSSERIGARWVIDGINSMRKHPIETFRFVLDNSNEVRARMETMDRDIQDAIRKETNKFGFIADIRRFGYAHIGYVDRFVAVTTWMGAYNKALNENMDDAQAMAFADRVVRQSQGAGAAKDLASIQRGKGAAGEASKYLTMFYSYMSAFYQRQRTLNRDYGKAFKSGSIGDFPELLARTMWLYFFPALASELLAGRPPEDDEEWWAWALEKIGLSALGPIPLVRDIAGGVASGFGYTFTPASGLGRTAVNLWKDGAHIWEGEETKRATRDVLEFAGYVGAPISGQVAASTQFLVDVSQGEQDPQDFGDWWEGIKSGKIKDD